MLATTPTPREGLAVVRDGTSILLGEGKVRVTRPRVSPNELPDFDIESEKREALLPEVLKGCLKANGEGPEGRPPTDYGREARSSDLRGEALHSSDLRGEALHSNDLRGEALHSGDLRAEAISRQTKGVTFDPLPMVVPTSKAVMDCWTGEVETSIMLIQEGMALVDMQDQELEKALSEVYAFTLGQAMEYEGQEIRTERLAATRTRGQRKMALREEQHLEWRRDTQDYTVTPAEVEYWKKKCGDLEVDACADPEGRNAVMKEFWSDALAAVWDGRKVWCNPPYNSGSIAVAEILQHFHESRQRDPTSQALFFLPMFTGAKWADQLKRMPYLKLIHTYEKGYPLFHAEDGALLKTRWKVGVYWSGEIVEGRKSAYEPVPSQAHPSVQVVTREASRPRSMGFLDRVVKLYAKDEQVQEWIALCESQTRRQDRRSGFRMAGNILWRVQEGNF
jgi:hypothetical protein